MSDWQAEQLIELTRQRFHGWEGFDHPEFVADEIAPKRKLVEKATAVLSQQRLDERITAGAFDTIIEDIAHLTRQTNLLWRRVPKSGDTAVLEDSTLDTSLLSIQIRNLLYGDRSSPERLQTFSDYLNAANLPNKWPFPTFLLFMTHPQEELFIKPQPARWFLKFVGSKVRFSSQPNGDVYAELRHWGHQLLDSLKPWGAQNMLDVQSLIWIGMRESKQQVGSLDKKSQIYLDVPPTTPLRTSPALREQENGGYGVENGRYTLSQMATETGYPENEIKRWLEVINHKGQAIYYGPPGTGKTFMAQKLARLMTQQGDGFWETIQFHPAYSYEDFVEGLRPLPSSDGVIFEKVPGRFMRFCQKAQTVDGVCVLIIDEINRANVTAVLGELMFLLEYRDRAIPLAGGTHFSIPKNVKIVATMNSADRSLALVDFALRRRFAFIEFLPRYELIKRYGSNIDIEQLIKHLEAINDMIGDSHYAIGHTYFLTPNLESHLQNIWELEIFPYLQEYFFEATDQLTRFRWSVVAPSIQMSGEPEDRSTE